MPPAGDGHRAEGQLLGHPAAQSQQRRRGSAQWPERQAASICSDVLGPGLSRRGCRRTCPISYVLAANAAMKSASKMMSASRIWPVIGFTRLGPMAKPALEVIQRNVL